MKQEIRLITPLSLLLQALGLMALGVLILAAPDFVDRFLSGTLTLSLWVYGALSAAAFLFIRKKRRAAQLALAVAALATGLAFAARPTLLQFGFGLLFGLWALLVGVIQGIYALQLKMTGSDGALRSLLTSVVSLLFGLALAVKPVSRFANVHLVAGLYFLLFSVSLLYEFLEELFKWDTEGNRLLARLRVSAPVLLTALLPSWLVEGINRSLEANNIDHTFEKGEDAPCSLEVLFHLGKHVAMGFGHVDLCHGGTVYSYGCYDASSNRLFGLLSDGVLMTAPREIYLDYCRRWEKKTLVGFSIRLDEKQNADVHLALERVLAQCEPWSPPEQEKSVPGSSGHAKALTGCSHYKLNSGPFRVYNACKTNCVAMAELVATQSGVALLPTAGIVTPGSYYAFLERRLQDPGSRVYKKTVYKRI